MRLHHAPLGRFVSYLIPLPLAAWLVLGGVPGAAADAPSDEVKQWIDRLGDDSAKVREEAAKKLQGLGQAALNPLRQAIKGHPDADVRLRAAVIVAAIQKELYGEVRRFTGHNGWVFRLVLSSDGKQAISAGDGLRVWDVATGRLVRTFAGSKASWGLALSADGKRVLCPGYDRLVRLWDVETGKQVQQFTGHTGEVWAVGLSPDGKRAITGAWDRTIRIWDSTGKELRRFEKVVDNPRCLAWSPDGKRVALGHFTAVPPAVGKGTVRLWDVETGKEVRAFEGHGAAVTCVAFSADGKRLASSSFDRTARLWDVATGKELKRFEGHTDAVEAVALTPDGKRLVTCGADKDRTVRLWDAATGKELARYEGHTGGVLCVAVTPDGKHALSGAKDGTLRLWPLH